MFQRKNEHGIDKTMSFSKEFDICTEKYIKSFNRTGITEGEGGLLLCLASLYHHTNEEKYYFKLNELLNKLLNSYNGNISFGKGLAGFAWALYQIKQLGLIDDDFDDWFSMVNDTLICRCDSFFSSSSNKLHRTLAPEIDMLYLVANFINNRLLANVFFFSIFFNNSLPGDS
jgi:hypothetical protein